MSVTPECLLVLTTLPTRDGAEAVARLLVEARHAACVNIVGPVQSVYRWQGVVEQAEEYQLLIKTTRTQYAALEAAAREHHPYELPELIAVPLVEGLPAYLQWLAASIGPIPA